MTMLFSFFGLFACGTSDSQKNNQLEEQSATQTETTDDDATSTDTAENPDPTTPAIARLTHRQWENTVKELLHLNEPTGFANNFIGSTIDDGFENNASSLYVGPLLFIDYQRAAEALSAMVVNDLSIYTLVVPQDPREGGNAEEFSLRLEAETDGTLTPEGNGQSNGDNFMVWSNGTLNFSVEIPAYGTYVISSYVTGTDCGQGVGAATQLIVNNSVIAETIALEGQTLEGTIELTPGTNSIGVSFTNDCYAPDEGFDRNLFVDWLNIQRFNTLGASAASEEDAQEWISAFGRQAFRRPLTDDEKQTWWLFFQRGPNLLASGDDFADGVQLVIQGMLQMPDFIYRIEETEYGESLDSYELAAKISYTLCNMPPDTELQELADQGLVKEKLAEQIDRLLSLPCATDNIIDFHRQLLMWDNYIHNYSEDEEWSEELNLMMIEEVKAYVHEVIMVDQGGIRELLLSNYTVANQRLANLYGTTGTDEWSRIDLDPDQRAGLLTLSGFLTYQSDATQSNPIHRGVFISQHLLCTTLPSPPDDITGLPVQDEGVTNRERVEAHTGEGTCGEGCHSVLINPLGFGLENYDQLGRYRELDNGQPVNAADSYGFADGIQSWTTGIEMIQYLADSSQAHGCYAKHLYAYLHGREIQSIDHADLEMITSSSLAGASTYELIQQIILSSRFHTRGQ